MKKSIFVTVFSTACAAMLLTAASAKSKEDAAAEVRAMFDQAAAEFVACDTSAIGKYDADEHTGYYPDSTELYDETSDEGRKEAADFCDNGGKHEMTYAISDVVMLKDAALVLGSGHYKRTEPDGTVSVDTDYTFTDVVVKTDKGWKFRHSHVGVVMPMEEGGESE
jgi:ketosteroid isomerase-like protein